MDEFMHFIAQAMQTPRLVLAFLERAIESQWPLYAAITALGSYVIYKRIRARRKAREPYVSALYLEEQAVSESTLDEEKFLAWYAARIEATNILISEQQARWLYAAYMSNQDVIHMQVASESEVAE